MKIILATILWVTGSAFGLPWDFQATHLCASNVVARSGLSAKARLGVSNVFQNQHYGPVTVWHPVGSRELPGIVSDLNAVPTWAKLPERFLLGDGGYTRAVVGIDQRPGSPLDCVLNELARSISREQAIEFLAFHLEDLVDGRWRLGVDGRGDNSWDPPAGPLSDQAWDTFREVGTWAIGHEPAVTDEFLPVVPFENFLIYQSSAYCIHKVLLARLLLDRLGIASRFVAGTVMNLLPGQQPNGFGHSWLEVQQPNSPDWIVLDPTQHRLGPKGGAHEWDSSWFWFQGQYRFANKSWPVLVL